MKKFIKDKLVFLIIIILFIVFIVYKGITTYDAHDTFDGYCKRRWLVVASIWSDFGYCKNPDTNKEFKIVLFKWRRFLDGDLPCGFLCF